ncbi:MAG: monovalent cation/H(+) antiporter subunit G [Halobacteria archaeon]
MSEWLVAALMAGGAAFSLLAAVGVVRMPDLYTRLQVATKATTLGTILPLSAAGLHFGGWDVPLRAAAVVLFLFLTAPVAAHMIGRAAYLSGEPLWDRSVRDDLRGRYDIERNILAGPPPEPSRGPREG